MHPENEKSEDRPVLYPFKRLLYSRKVLIAFIALIVSLLGEFGLPQEIIANFNLFALAVIISWTAKDMTANLRK